MTYPLTSMRAFTLLELIICVAIVALVVCLTLPHLRGSRWLAQELKSTANLRSHSQIMASYALDESDSFPFFTHPEATLSVVRGGGVAVAIPHFQSFWTWNIALADNYFGGVVLPDSLVIPWQRAPDPVTMYWYGDCFIARPEYWRRETRRLDASQLRATRASEVQFPSAKGLILEAGWMQGVRGRGFREGERFSSVDGSARRFAPGELRSPYVGGVGLVNGGGSFRGHLLAMPVMHTQNGVLGQDAR